jgi:lipopolysaccharide assembly outer membrane protein LptD (OstA)
MKKLLILLFVSSPLFAQDDLLAMLEKEDAKKTTYTQATFKGTRLINGQTVETLAKQHLNFWISHRFGSVNSGFIDNFFGLDEAKIRLGVEYSLTDRILLGAGRSTIEKTYDLYGKYKVLAQSNKMPVTATLYGGMATNTMPTGYTTSIGNVMRYENNLQRQSYFGQVLIARKFSDKLSLQIMPTVLHNNKSESIYLDNNLLSMGVGGRYKLTNRFSISAEYYKNIVDKEDYEEGAGTAYPYQDSFSVGVDIETGGHVFQFHMTNSRGMTEKHFIGQTTGTWGAGDIFYGFNIARTFSLEPKKK